ncbi:MULTISPECIES: energy transducer TonB [unclassified Shewanella]|uniref:energy transducer TonB n=1 Tax=unclassified Shewanella TaxID=196818 RepID=UPI001BBFEF47|nr:MULTISPECIES: energy transducer TonB [unclassified Shewanella]GIU08603.1 hypothetical protein TUM4444_09940 [Shewanella sp. MBTL60-112-B1]GIU38357.1 hypothetical protein TUM4445_32290 [Shewanella sp. MBTL60-112-B2]
MKVIGLAILVLLFVPQVSQAKNIYGEVLLTDLEPKTQKVWHREGNKSPHYPVALVQAKLQGCTVLSFDISEEGYTENVEVVSSIPNKHLGKYTKKEIKGWRWQQLEPLQSASSEKRTLRFDYCLGLESAEQSLAQCQQQAQLNCG